MYKKMLSSIILLLVFSGQSVALSVSECIDGFCGFGPYVGVTAHIVHMDFKKGYGNNLLFHNSPKGSIYYGIQLDESFGFEVGYEVTEAKPRHVEMTTGDINCGIQVPDIISPLIYKSNLRIKGIYSDLVYNYHFYDNSKLSAIGYVGGSFFRASFKRNLISVAGHPIPITRLFSAKKLLFRFGSGFRYRVTDTFYVNTTVGWVNTSKLKAKSDRAKIHPSLPTPTIKPHDSVVYSLGFMYRF